MANHIDPMELVCAHCGEQRPEKFGKTRTDVEFELTPVDGIQTVYLCRSCKSYADQGGFSNEHIRLLSQFTLVRQGKLGQGADAELIRRRIIKLS